MCKFKDDQRSFVTIKRQEVEAMFTAPDIENVVTFWRDVSYGEVDLSGSKTFGWLTLDQKQQDFKDALTTLGNQKARTAMFSWALKAASDAEIKLDSYYGVTVYMSTPTDLWGSLQGSNGQVVCDTASSLPQILQEYGHGYGLQHSRSVIDPTDYTNPFCVMSSMSFGRNNQDGTWHDPRFIGHDPTFAGRNGSSGPGLCSPYISQKGWLPDSRTQHVGSNGIRPETTILKLSALGEFGAAFPQAAIIEFDSPRSLTYFIEYRRGGWDKGITYNPVVIHQLGADNYSYFAGYIRTVATDITGKEATPVGRWYVDGQFDLSVEFLSLVDDGAAILIRIAPAAAGRDLSVRGMAASKLQLTEGFSMKNQVLTPGEESVRGRLVSLLDR
jgi:hypothetical protein